MEHFGDNRPAVSRRWNNGRVRRCGRRGQQLSQGELVRAIRFLWVGERYIYGDSDTKGLYIPADKPVRYDYRRKCHGRKLHGQRPRLAACASESSNRDLTLLNRWRGVLGINGIPLKPYPREAIVVPTQATHGGWEICNSASSPRASTSSPRRRLR
jgi:hypothetical protein